MFTILNDAHASSLCINCLEEEDLDLCYSETSVGCCDDCGTLGNPALTPIVIAATEAQAESWARYRNLDRGKTITVGTDSSSVKNLLEGRVLIIEQIVLLPIAEEGKDWKFFERVLDRAAARGLVTAKQISAATINAHQIGAGIGNFQMSITANIDASGFKNYQRMLYGVDPGLKTGIASTKVTP